MSCMVKFRFALNFVMTHKYITDDELFKILEESDDENEDSECEVSEDEVVDVKDHEYLYS